MNQYVVKLNSEDNVAIAIKDIPSGTEVSEGLVAKDMIPQAHKIALKDIKKGGEIRRYNTVIGYAKEDIQKGRWISQFMVSLPKAPGLDDMEYGTHIVKDLPEPPVKNWWGYPNPKGGPAGTRNVLGIMTTVQCAVGVGKVAVERIKKELLPQYPNVDDVVLISHEYGCGVAINAPEAKIPIRILQNLVHQPNFGGQVMVLSLGCEKLTVERLLPPEEVKPENIVVLQDQHGFEKMVDAIMEMAEKKLAILNQRKRVELPLSDLVVGLQCGGSDAFSGVTCNPSAGYASDMLVKGGATVMFSEVTEARDGIHLLAARCINRETRDKMAAEVKWYDEYLKEGAVDRDANPTPGNKKGGLANIVEKSMGSIAKSGTAPISEVLAPGELPSQHGLIFAVTPANDFACGTCQMASGIGVHVFMTGRGSTYGLPIVPVIKLCSRSDLWEKWPDLIDLNAGPIALGKSTIAEIGTQLFKLIIDVASGKKSLAEQHKIYNDLCVFNPAPLT
ncbi:MAG: UxaA family hydrolase [Acidaminococcus sp.]|jgi:galactarate dehydratase|nr:UxaA family hydrolase [Acidaminococcus sp.]MCI2100893.1 UxaA family hydrolase [Acidaminococcus sp.]MCI2117306.1 UxaA family hydrolase [Acidaminococcus sp.]